MQNKIKFTTFITGFVLFAFLVPAVFGAYAGECAQIETYVVDLSTGLGVPGAQARVRCQNTFPANGEVHQCTETTRNPDGSPMYGACWENSGWYDVPMENAGHILFGTTDNGYDCFVGNPKLEVTNIPTGWTEQCVTDGSRINCNDGSNINKDDLPAINGGSFVFKIFYSPPIAPTNTPTPTTPPSLSPTPTVTPTLTPTNSPTPTNTPTPTTPPSLSPTPTVTVCPTPGAVNNVRIECPYCGQ